MAKLSDYGINVDDLSSSAIVTIHGQEFPIAFTMETMEYVADIYEQDYAVFERDTNAMILKKEGTFTTSQLTPQDLKIMRTLIYSMLRTGGLDESPDTIMKFLGMSSDILGIYGVCMEIFSNQTFQVEDLKKSVKPQDFQKKNKKSKRKKNPKKR